LLELVVLVVVVVVVGVVVAAELLGSVVVVVVSELDGGAGDGLPAWGSLQDTSDAVTAVTNTTDNTARLILLLHRDWRRRRNTSQSIKGQQPHYFVRKQHRVTTCDRGGTH
jgi:hypothetical protein